ncbi:MAG: hypothetical protein ACRCUF_15630, partial [Aeromonas sobria]
VLFDTDDFLFNTADCGPDFLLLMTHPDWLQAGNLLDMYISLLITQAVGWLLVIGFIKLNQVL